MESFVPVSESLFECDYLLGLDLDVETAALSPSLNTCPKSITQPQSWEFLASDVNDILDCIEELTDAVPQSGTTQSFSNVGGMQEAEELHKQSVTIQSLSHIRNTHEPQALDNPLPAKRLTPTACCTTTTSAVNNNSIPALPQQNQICRENTNEPHSRKKWRIPPLSSNLQNPPPNEPTFCARSLSDCIARIPRVSCINRIPCVPHIPCYQMPLPVPRATSVNLQLIPVDMRTKAQRIARWREKKGRRRKVIQMSEHYQERRELATKRLRKQGRFTGSKVRWINC